LLVTVGSLRTLNGTAWRKFAEIVGIFCRADFLRHLTKFFWRTRVRSQIARFFRPDLITSDCQEADLLRRAFHDRSTGEIVEGSAVPFYVDAVQQAALKCCQDRHGRSDILRELPRGCGSRGAVFQVRSA
jgi:hypothetical protein